MIPVPAIDILDGRVVRLLNGRFDDVTYYDGSPLDYAHRLERAGMKRLHLVDLDGARSGRHGILDVVSEIARTTSLVVDVGGGISTGDDVRRLLDAGAAMVCIGTLAVVQPRTVGDIAAQYGSHAIIVAIDVAAETVRIRGWKETSSFRIDDVMDDMTDRGLCRFMITDISRDGMMNGPAFASYERLRERYASAHLIASGGVRGREDMNGLAAIGMDGAVIGRAWLDDERILDEIGGMS
ncbi:MAG: 1-(5-phosphoribosyl)-5-[(5-phosphoribosylamino)methylideneamino] imidazole-4-carboxamide isomerase ['Candidatus Kapabacteria' thiocyanatum]|uniref:1-(5-phosphoribosyl)-5-[(5-phosphoribosylamino)methylideneamino] imidazole-4-carboxamide isomerase n=1 Tax=Candidatus Kapaibacterium thiocyanatum TaxID=1895771 RepID=A0A1M3L324_9BACT|nr:1-(5-phosphoribosyl)-5-[(5-phosphoribosylamino)methylideneamino] imidazole-4-carboxamide isomerase ['Candidatus Kapabacteria' thiocyanatum]OJX59709.1 MAG: hypothetical protein BGO89_05690 ['Candidatus Kapabacteria' thiocyanatum]